MISGPLYKLPVKLLSDLASSRALEKILQDAAAQRGLSVEQLDAPTLEAILKNDVYKRLQQTVPAPLAKKRVMEVLKELEKAPKDAPPEPEIVESQLPALEDQAKKFSLYFDWPEMQRLRGVLGLARTEEEAGHSTSSLVAEAQELLSQMERRLAEGLVAQAQDLAELKATLNRVQGIGGRDVKRLESLIGQIEEAQTEQTLLPGEVERARNTAFKLRKSMESSVVQSLDGAATTPEGESQTRVQALEQEHATRQLGDLSREFAPLLRARADLQLQNDDLRQRQAAGQLPLEALESWRQTLEAARQTTLNEQREELGALESQLTDLPEGAAAHDIRVALDVARGMLNSGNLATDELNQLRISARALTHSSVDAGKVLELQREIMELERSARDVPGAEAELAAQLNAARDALARGQSIDLTPLWATLEHHMGQAAQQRENFDARADHVVREYDKVRSLAGETTQRLGRMADTLRAQRRLGQLSAQARERYAQTLSDAEALLAEARAEYQAAQEVTSTFGQDALSDLLDVFDVGGDSESELFAFGSATPAPTVTSPAATAAPASGSASTDGAAPKPGGSIFDSLLGGRTRPEPVTTPTPALDVEETPRESLETDWGEFGAARSNKWNIEDGLVVGLSGESHVKEMALLLRQADKLGLNRLDMADSVHVWSARQVGPGQWRLARARDWDALDASAGIWLDTGQS